MYVCIHVCINADRTCSDSVKSYFFEVFFQTVSISSYLGWRTHDESPASSLVALSTSSGQQSRQGPFTRWQTARIIPSVCSVLVTWCSNYLVAPSDMSAGDRTRFQYQKRNEGSTWPPGFNGRFVKSVAHKS